MTLSDLDMTWANSFESQDIPMKFQRCENSNMCCVSDLPQPRPQRSSFDASILCHDEIDEEFSEHHLEHALKDMVDNGELEDFLRINTINLKQIQDDMQVNYDGQMVRTELQVKPRERRHSIGSCEDLIKCPFPGCDKIFNRSYNFKSHMKVHSGEKPFKCNHCELSFARCHDLKRHEKIHNKCVASQNICNLCGKTFSRPDALNRHKKFNSCHIIAFKGFKNTQ